MDLKNLVKTFLKLPRAKHGRKQIITVPGSPQDSPAPHSHLSLCHDVPRLGLIPRDRPPEAKPCTGMERQGTGGSIPAGPSPSWFPLQRNWASAKQDHRTFSAFHLW